MTTIRFATFLSPLLYDTYEHIASYVGKNVGCSTLLSVGQSLEEFANGQTDVAFLCGLPYVHMTSRPSCPIELLGAPVLQGKRYQGRPIYFSDVVVRRDSPYTSFDDIQGCIWAYNERASHSGCNIVCHSLLARGKTPHYFGRTVETGSHLQSLQAVLEGKADATAIDSHVLDVFLFRNRDIAEQLRIIDMLGPSTIPPVVVAKRLDDDLKHRIRAALATMHHDPHAAYRLREGLIDHFALIDDEHYQDVRSMFARVQTMESPFE